MAKITLHIDGMHCAACVRRVSQALSTLEGATVSEVRVGAARLTLPDSTPDEAILAAVAQTGFTAQIESR